MSLTVAVGDLIQVRLNFARIATGEVAMNVLHYRIASISGVVPPLPETLAALGEATYNKFKDLWSPMASNLIQFASVTTQSVFPLPRSVAWTFIPGDITEGAIDGDSLPLQDAPTLLKQTAVGQRWGLGRMFYVGLAESEQNIGVVDVDAAALLNAMAGQLATTTAAIVAGSNVVMQPVLVRGPSDNPVSVTPITGGRLSDLIIKTQRRRRPGKGI